MVETVFAAILSQPGSGELHLVAFPDDVLLTALGMVPASCAQDASPLHIPPAVEKARNVQLQQSVLLVAA